MFALNQKFTLCSRLTSFYTTCKLRECHISGLTVPIDLAKKLNIARHILSHDASRSPFPKRSPPAKPATLRETETNDGLRARFAKAVISLIRSKRHAVWLAWLGLIGVVLGLSFFDGDSVFSRLLIAVGAVSLLAAVHVATMLPDEPVDEPHDLDKLNAVSRRIDKRIEQLEDVRWQLRDNNQRLRDLLDAQEDVIMRRDAGGRLTFVNRASCTRFAIKPEDVLGTDFSPSELVAADAEADVATHVTESADRLAGDIRYIETAAGPRWFLWREKLIPAQDGLSYDTLMIGRDVTAQHRYETELAAARDEAEAASRAKSRFLASMSHEIRTPMNGILGMSGLLLESELSANQRTYVTAVDQSARTLLALIDEILDFSRIEANRLDLNPVPFSIADCIQSVVELLAPRAHDKDLEIAWSIAPRCAKNIARR